MIDTKIWNEIVSWRSNWLVESCLEFFTHFWFSLSNAVSSEKNFIFISSEIWYKVIDWPCWFLPTRITMCFVPRSRSWSWSVRSFWSLSILREECKGYSAGRNRFKHFKNFNYKIWIN
jgi:hypothetical protein